MCMFRWIKLDSVQAARLHPTPTLHRPDGASFSFCQCGTPGFFGGMFEQLRQVLAENYVIFRTLSPCASCQTRFVCLFESLARRGSPSFWQRLFGYQGPYLCIMPSVTTRTKVPMQQADVPFLLDGCFAPGERARYSGSLPHPPSFLLDDWTGLHQRSSCERPFCPGACL